MRAGPLLAAALLAMPGAGPIAPAAGPELAQFSADYAELTRSVRRLTDRIGALEAELATLRARLEAAEGAQAEALTPRTLAGRRVAPGDPVVAPVTFVLDADPRGGPRSMTLPLAEFAPRCADPEGCLATLAIAGFAEEGRPFEAALGLGPCLMHHDAASGAWSVAAACDMPPGADPLGRHGRDGGASPLSPQPAGARVLLDFAGACLLSEAPPARFLDAGGAPALAPGGVRDLHLVAASADWHLGGRFPADLLPAGARFACRLTLRD